MSSDNTRITRRDWLISASFLVILLWVNLYVCRGLFTKTVPATNSMHGFWATIAHWAGNDWFQSNWWPWWDNGIPFEFTYAPLVPALTALFSSLFHTSRILAMQSVTAIAYSLGPMTLYFMTWRLSGAPVYSFLAALFYSLFSPMQILMTPGSLAWSKINDEQRLFLTTFWDDTPHLLALSLLPLAILFLTRAIERRSIRYSAAAAVTIAVMTLASTFGPVMTVLAVICLLLALRPRWPALLLVAVTGVYSYALCARFLTPSLLLAISASSKNDGGGWNSRSWLAVGCVVAGLAIVWFAGRRIKDRSFHFVLLFAWITLAIPALDVHFHTHFLPQPGRYAFEAELGLASALAFCIRAALRRAPRALSAGLLVLFLVACYSQIKVDRRDAKNWIKDSDLTTTIEYRAAVWASAHLPGERIYLPGSMNKWGGDFAQLQQFSGSSWSQAYSQLQQFGVEMLEWGAATPEDHRRLALPWLRAYGLDAVCVNGPKSHAYWPNPHPLQLDGIYPVLWREDDTTIYRLPKRTPGFAHLVSESAILREEPKAPNDVAGIDRYVAALDQPAFPAATFAWEGTNRIHIHTDARPDQVLSVQVSWHPGWHAVVGGKKIDVRKDGLGLMWMRPECNGACDLQLDYDGGWELRICRWLGYVAWAGLIVWFVLARLTRSRATAR